MSRKQRTRRQFITTATTATALGLAGCSSETDGEATGEDVATTGAAGGETEDSEAEDGEQTPAFQPAAEDATASFVTPTDGESAAGGVSVVMSAEGLTIEEAGEVAADAGHFHVLVDTGPVEAGEVVPSDDQHRHFGDGATETVLDLDPGEHTLTLQVADGLHRAYDVTDTVEVTVEEASASFANVADGDTVSSPVELEWTTDGYELEAAGEVSQSAGHAHVLVDTDPVAVGDEIPSDDKHLHFGDGSASAELDLDPGEHTLTLQLGNGHHLATPLTDTVTVTVEES